MGNGPIAVAFVEIRPEPGSFQAATDAEIRETFGGDAVSVPAELRLSGLDDVRRTIDTTLGDIEPVAAVAFEPDTRQAERSLRELRREEVEIPVEPDTSTFRADLEREVRAVTAGRPIGVPVSAVPSGGAVVPSGAAVPPTTAATAAAAAADTHAGEAAHAHAEGISAVTEEAGHAHGALEALAGATEHAGHAAEEAAGGHGGHGAGIEGVSAGAGEAVGQAGALFVANERLAKGTARLTLEDEKLGIANHHLAVETRLAGEAAQILDDSTTNMALASRHATTENSRLAASEKIAQAALARTAAEERELIRTRVRRAVPIGPFRLAGVGTAVAAGVVALSQATAALSEGLAVTGEEADTFSGRMRNLGANLLNFNVIGAFQALRTEHDELSISQLRLIGSSAELTDQIRELAGATDFAASQAAALGQLTAGPPAFLQAALARETEAGDVEGQVRVLERIRDSQIRAEQIARELPLEPEQLNAALAAIIAARIQTRQQLEELHAEELPRAEALEHAQEEGNLEEIIEVLRLRAADQRKAMSEGDAVVTEQEAANAELQSLNQRIRAARANLNRATGDVVEASRPGRFQRTPSTATAGGENEALEEVRENALKELVKLRNDRIELLQAMEELDHEAEELGALEHQLEETNHAIEEAVEALKEEQQRHISELTQQRSVPLEEAVLLAQIANDTNAEVAALQKLRDFYERRANAKGISGELRNDYLSRVEALNNQIEGIEAGITAEEERHASEQDATRDRQHQALLAGIARDEQDILNRLVLAETTARLSDDLKFRKQLVAFYKAQAANLKLTVEERARFRDQYVAAVAELKRLNQEIREAERDELRAEIEAREDLLRDQVTLAELNERSTRDEAKALRKLIAFYKKQAANRDLSRSERRDYLIKQRQAEKELRDLAEDETKKSDVFAQQAFEFLQTQAGFAANLLGNLIPGFATQGLVGNNELTGTFTATIPPGSELQRSATSVPSPFAQQRATAAAGPQPFTSGQGNTTNDLLRKILVEVRRTNVGDEHPEANRQRRAGAAAFDYGGGGGTMGM